MGLFNTAVISHVLEQKKRKEILCRQLATYITVILIIIQNGNITEKDPRQKQNETKSDMKFRYNEFSAQEIKMILNAGEHNGLIIFDTKP